GMEPGGVQGPDVKTLAQCEGLGADQPRPAWLIPPPRQDVQDVCWRWNGRGSGPRPRAFAGPVRYRRRRQAYPAIPATPRPRSVRLAGSGAADTTSVTTGAGTETPLPSGPPKVVTVGLGPLSSIRAPLGFFSRGPYPILNRNESDIPGD